MPFYIKESPLTITYAAARDTADGEYIISNVEDLAGLKTGLLVDIYNQLNHADPAADPTSRDAPLKCFQSKAKAIPRVWTLLQTIPPAAPIPAEQGGDDAKPLTFLLTHAVGSLDDLTVERYINRKAARKAQRVIEERGNKHASFIIEGLKDCGNEFLHTSTITDILFKWGVEDVIDDRAVAERRLFDHLKTHFKDLPALDSADDLPEGATDPATGEGDTTMSTKKTARKRGNATPRKVKATGERKVRAERQPRENSLRAYITTLCQRARGASKKEILESINTKFPDRNKNDEIRTSTDNTVRGLLSVMGRDKALKMKKEKDDKRGLVYSIAS